jgi:hypothetical protein
MNKERILALADIIEKQPHVEHTAAKGFNMWGYRHPCGSPSCIAGWAIHSFPRVRSDEGPQSHAAKILGISWDEASPLFDPEHYVEGVMDMRSITPAHAAAVLRHLASSGEVDWSVGAPVEAAL